MRSCTSLLCDDVYSKHLGEAKCPAHFYGGLAALDVGDEIDSHAAPFCQVGLCEALLFSGLSNKRAEVRHVCDGCHGHASGITIHANE